MRRQEKDRGCLVVSFETLLGVMALISALVAAWNYLGAHLLLIFAALLLPFVFLVKLDPARPLLRRTRALLGSGRGLDELSRRLGISAAELKGAPVYRFATIPKRTSGTRELTIPDDSTKRIQRLILRRVLFGLRAHPTAKGFERGLSIVHNASFHVGAAVVIRLDIVDFFPSIGARTVERYFRRVGWNRTAARALARWTTCEGALPQGAPTSPRISNIVNVRLDARLLGLVRRFRGYYTRYADDITISLPRSSPHMVRTVIRRAFRICAEHGYTLHDDRKLSVRRRGERQLVTGLVVNERVNLPREVRRRLRAVRHHLDTGRSATMTEQQWQGWVALATMIEKQRP